MKAPDFPEPFFIVIPTKPGGLSQPVLTYSQSTPYQVRTDNSLFGLVTALIGRRHGQIYAPRNSFSQRAQPRRSEHNVKLKYLICS